MDKCPHKLAGIYTDSTVAKKAYDTFLEAGFSENQVMYISPEDRDIEQKIEPETDAARDVVIQDTAAGGAIGATAGVVGAAGAAVATPVLFAGAPVVGPLMMASYGLAIGGAVGALRGIQVENNVLSSIVKDAAKQNFYVVVVHTGDKDEEIDARSIMNKTVPSDDVQV